MVTHAGASAPRTAAATAREAHRTGAWDDALLYYELAIDQAEAAGCTAEAADILRWMGDLFCDRGDLDSATTHFEASRAAAEKAELPDRLARALNALATVQILRGAMEPATESLLRARALAERIGDDKVVAMVDQNLGTIANIQGNAVVALLSYRSALAHYRKAGDDRLATRVLNNMGMAHVDLGEWEAAEHRFAEASALAQRTGDQMMCGRVDLNRSELFLKRRQFDDALESVERSLLVFQSLRARASIAEAYKMYGIIYRETGKPGQADTHFGLALHLAELCQNPLLQAEAQLEWALLLLQEERTQDGILYMNRALRLYRDLQAGRAVLDIERRLDALRELYLPAVQAWSASHSHSADPFSAGREERVAEYATQLARALGVEGWELTWIQIGAMIHDVGNMAIPAEVLTGADALDAPGSEYLAVKSIMGGNLVRQMEFPEEVHPIVRNHAEQWMGAGLPDQLAGEGIPLGARIVAIAQVYDALSTPRSFRDAYSRDEALRMMRSEAERFDPTLLDTFCSVLMRGQSDG